VKLAPGGVAAPKPRLSAAAAGAECIYFIYKQVVNYLIHQRRRAPAHLGEPVEQQARLAIGARLASPSSTPEISQAAKIDPFPFFLAPIDRAGLPGRGGDRGETPKGISSRLILP